MLDELTKSLIFPQATFADNQPGWIQSPGFPLGTPQQSYGGPPQGMVSMNDFEAAQENEDEEGYDDDGLDFYAGNEKALLQAKSEAGATPCRKGELQRQNSTINTAGVAETNGAGKAQAAGAKPPEPRRNGAENSQDKAARLRAQLLAQRASRGQTKTPEVAAPPVAEQRPPLVAKERPASAAGKASKETPKPKNASPALVAGAARPGSAPERKTDAESANSTSAAAPAATTLPQTSIEIEALIAEARDDHDKAHANSSNKPNGTAASAGRAAATRSEVRPLTANLPTQTDQRRATDAQKRSDISRNSMEEGEIEERQSPKTVPEQGKPGPDPKAKPQAPLPQQKVVTPSLKVNTRGGELGAAARERKHHPRFLLISWCKLKPA